jgi:hypothetical protein
LPSLLSRRLDALEASMGGGPQVAVGRICPACGAQVDLSDVGPCHEHQPLREAEMILLVRFVAPHD